MLSDKELGLGVELDDYEVELIRPASSVKRAAEGTARWMTDLIIGKHTFLPMHNPIALVVMRGGMFFAAQVLQHIDELITVDYIHLSRYEYADKFQGDQIHWHRKPPESIANRNVFIVDDIFDEGITLNEARQQCISAGAAQVVTVVMCCKADIEVPSTVLRPDYYGFMVPNQWVFGCGMDFKGLYRNNPNIWAIAGGKHDD